MSDKYQNKYRIPSARLQCWDYGSNGAYFITICTAKGKHFFGKIKNGQMQLSAIEEKVNHCWLAIPNHFPFVLLDEFIVMPNHTHGIIVIDKPIDYDGGNDPFIVETGHALSLQSKQPQQTEIHHHPRFRNQGKIRFRQWWVPANLP